MVENGPGESSIATFGSANALLPPLPPLLLLLCCGARVWGRFHLASVRDRNSLLSALSRARARALLLSRVVSASALAKSLPVAFPATVTGDN